MLKAHFVLEILSFCLDFLVMWKNSLIRKPRLILRFTLSQTGQQIMTIQTMLNIPRSKDNQALKNLVRPYCFSSGQHLSLSIL